MTKLKRKPKQGQTFSMWGREFTISRVCPMQSWIEVSGPRPEELTDVDDGVMSFTYVPALRPSSGTIDFRISTYHARRLSAESPRYVQVECVSLGPGPVIPAMPIDESDPYGRMRFGFGSDRVDEARRLLGDGATPQTVYDHLTAWA